MEVTLALCLTFLCTLLKKQNKFNLIRCTIYILRRIEEPSDLEKEKANMAKYEKTLEGNFNELLNWLHNDITNGSISVSYEDGSDITMGQIKLAVRVYERYSMMGGNRVSLNVTLIGDGTKLFISAITSGGSQAVFFKLNTIGEESFLELCSKSVEKYILQH